MNKGSTERQSQGVVRNCVQPSCGQLSPEAAWVERPWAHWKISLDSQSLLSLAIYFCHKKSNQYWVSQGTELGRKLNFLSSHMHSAPYTNMLLLLFEMLIPQANQWLALTLFRKRWALSIDFFSSAVMFSSREPHHPFCVGSYCARSELSCRFHGPVSLAYWKLTFNAKGSRITGAHILQTGCSVFGLTSWIS